MKNVFLRKGWLFLLVPALLVGIPVACFLPAPPQAWDPDRGPVVPHDSFPADCGLCHVTENWHTIKEDFQFDHAAETGYPLLAAHEGAGCLLCHNDRGPVEMFANRGCRGCHEDPHDGYLGTTCDACHDQRTWTPNEMIAEHASTRFPLVGAHALTACFACHPGSTAGNFQRADTHCISCHGDALARATEPNHVELGWTDCERCHLPTAFSDVRFGHTEGFRLTGAHKAASCDACHEGNVFTTLPTDCSACHQPEFDATTEPDHAAAGFPNTCDDCHSTNPGWLPAAVNHDFFALTRGHSALNCTACHGGGVYEGTPDECSACHLPDYNGAGDPEHAAAGFPTECDACHSTNPGWRPAALDHDLFALTLGHGALDCNACHQGGVFAGTPDECSACHLPDYNGASDPNHATAGFPTECDACHSTNPGWAPAALDHDLFALTLGHAALDCNDCHQGGVFAGTPDECSACHLPDYNGTSDPDHAAALYPTTCDACHTTTPGWSPAVLNHDSFALTQGHSALDCTACHGGGVYQGTPNECSACHLPDYNGATDPNHADAKYPTTCDDCHTTRPGWSPATFDHSGFALTQGHSGLDCADCHEGGVYQGTSSDCSVCHIDDFNGTDDPNHQSAGFPTTCDACHTTRPGWTPSTFDHSSFRITGGAHGGLSCTDCHKNPSSYASFTCTDCHEHGKSQTDRDHSEVRNYVYSSSACLNCHPDGRDD